jgi:hypothetical protein
MPNLCSITSLGIPSISDICHSKTSKFLPEKSGEHKFLFGVELRVETKLLVGVVGVHLNVLGCPPCLIICRLISGWLVRRRAHECALLFCRWSGVPLVGGLGATVLTGVLPPCVLAILAANSYASFSSNHPTCVSAAFSHDRASR